MGRKKVSSEEVRKTLEEFERFLGEKMDEMGDGIFISPHEIRGALDEEVDEFHEAFHENDIEDLTKALFAIAAAAIWGVTSLEKI